MDKKSSAVLIIKKHLWTFGHKVKDISGIPDAKYDLLVNGKVRLKVFAQKVKDELVGSPDYDIAAFVHGKDAEKVYTQRDNYLPEASPTPHPFIPWTKRPKRR